MDLCVRKVCAIIEVKALEGTNNDRQLGYGEKGRRKNQAAGQVAGESIEKNGGVR